MPISPSRPPYRNQKITYSMRENRDALNAFLARPDIKNTQVYSDHGHLFYIDKKANGQNRGIIFVPGKDYSQTTYILIYGDRTGYLFSDDEMDRIVATYCLMYSTLHVKDKNNVYFPIIHMNLHTWSFSAYHGQHEEGNEIKETTFYDKVGHVLQYGEVIEIKDKDLLKRVQEIWNREQTPTQKARLGGERANFADPHDLDNNPASPPDSNNPPPPEDDPDVGNRDKHMVGIWREDPTQGVGLAAKKEKRNRSEAVDLNDLYVAPQTGQVDDREEKLNGPGHYKVVQEEKGFKVEEFVPDSKGKQKRDILD